MHRKTRQWAGFMLMLALAMPLWATPAVPADQPARAWVDVSGWMAQWWGALVGAWSAPDGLPAAGPTPTKDGEPADDDDDATRHYLQIEPGG